MALTEENKDVLPLFYYTSKIAWVDDDEVFIRTIERELKSINEYTVKFFYNPVECLQYCLDSESVLNSVSFFKGRPDYESYDSKDIPIDLDTSSFNYIIDNDRKRLEEISVVIIDYNMPQMNGLELCEKLRHLPMKKMLLTGESTYEQALWAFNKGLIDCFIRKDSPNLIENIKFQINKMVYDYFLANSRHLLSCLQLESLLPPSDSKFVSFFKSFYEQNKIVDFFAVDKNCNFLLIDQYKKKSYLAVYSDSTLDAFIFNYQDDLKTAGLLKDIVNRKQIPFFINAEPWQVDAEEWHKYFYATNIIEGRERYFWASIK